MGHKTLHVAAKASTASSECEVYEELVREKVKEILAVEAQQKRALEIAKNAWDSLPNGPHRRIATIKGIGIQTACALVAKIISNATWQGLQRSDWPLHGQTASAGLCSLGKRRGLRPKLRIQEVHGRKRKGRGPQYQSGRAAKGRGHHDQRFKTYVLLPQLWFERERSRPTCCAHQRATARGRLAMDRDERTPSPYSVKEKSCPNDPCGRINSLPFWNQ